MKRLTIELSEELFFKVKIHCVEKGISIKEYITELIKKNIQI